MNVLFTICARKGSAGLKNKNILNFLEYPLSYYSMSAYDLFVKNYPDINCDIAINTDSDELVEQAKKTKVKFVYIKRTKELSGGEVGKIDVIRDTYLKMKKDYDFVIDLDLTSPLRTVENIKEALSNLAENENADICVSVVSSRRSPYFNQLEKNKNFFQLIIKTNILTRQQTPETYDMNASIYVYRPQFLLGAKHLFDGKVVVAKMKDTGVLDIDSAEDKELMEVVAKYFYQKYPEYKLIYKNIKNIFKL